METPYFLVSFERGRRSADRAAASAFAFPKGAAGSSFARVFLLEKRKKWEDAVNELGKSGDERALV